VSRLTVNRFAAAVRVLACISALAVLLFGLLAAHSGFHQAMHHGGTADSSSCVLCLFANGHVDLPQSAPVISVSVRHLLDSAPVTESIVLAEFTYLASPSRALPALPSLLPVVA
jgi:hypothetical protein